LQVRTPLVGPTSPKLARGAKDKEHATSKALNDFARSVLDEASDHRHGAFSFGHCRQLAKRSN